jgi:hypothetical protein
VLVHACRELTFEAFLLGLRLRHSPDELPDLLGKVAMPVGK